MKRLFFFLIFASSLFNHITYCNGVSSPFHPSTTLEEDVPFLILDNSGLPQNLDFSSIISDIHTPQIKEDFKTTPKVTLTSSLNPADEGYPFTFFAEVEGDAGPGSGTLLFTINGEHILVNVVNGIAFLTISNLPLGSHHIEAIYQGDSSYNCSLSHPLTQIIGNDKETRTHLTCSINPSMIDQPITLTAKVIGSPTFGIPTGSVAFIVGGIESIACLKNGKATFTTPIPQIGPCSLEAIYLGNRDYHPSASTLIQNVLPKNGTILTLIPSVTPSELGESVTFTATVKSVSGSTIPTGNITFYLDGIPKSSFLPVNAIASFTTSHLTKGNHPIFAFFEGDEIHEASLSHTLNHIVEPKVILPPENLKVRRISKRYGKRTDLINRITWKAPVRGNYPAAFKIYRDSDLKHSIATIQNTQDPKAERSPKKFSFEDNQRNKESTYRYYIVSVDEKGKKSAPAEVVFHPG